MLEVFNIIALVFCGFEFFKLEKCFKSLLNIMKLDTIDTDFWSEEKCEEKI